MREYKFRGKTEEMNSWWTYGNLVICDNGDYQIGNCPRYGDIYYRNKVFKETVGQYTGLHDKNGKEIYEGDIVKSFFVDTDEAGDKIYKYYIIEVKYDEVLCSYKIDKFMNLEVIGNIYENKELLNETNR